MDKQPYRTQPMGFGNRPALWVLCLFIFRRRIRKTHQSVGFSYSKYANQPFIIFAERHQPAWLYQTRIPIKAFLPSRLGSSIFSSWINLYSILLLTKSLAILADASSI